MSDLIAALFALIAALIVGLLVIAWYAIWIVFVYAVVTDFLDLSIAITDKI